MSKSRASLESRQAELQHAEATLVESRQILSRLEELKRRNATVEQEVDKAAANFARAEANVSSSKAQIAVAQATLDGDLSKLQKSRIYSPIDGLVLVRDVEPGQTVAATLQTPILLTICEDLRRMKLKVDVDEADVGGVQEGQAATVSVDAYPNERFPATITSFRYAPRRAQDVVTYEAVLEVANDQLKLRPGMTAVADIITAKIEDALLIPNAALRFSPEDNVSDVPLEAGEDLESRVWILEENVPVPIPVTTGNTDGRFTEIRSGDIEEGAPLVVNAIP